MILSVIVAMILTPALCATILRPPKHHGERRGFFGWFNRTFDRGTRAYRSGSAGIIHRGGRFLMLFLAIGVATGWLFMRLPGSFLPDEDRGILLSSVQMPVGATQDRTLRVLDRVKDYYLTERSEEHTSDLQSLMRISYAVFCLKKKKK